MPTTSEPRLAELAEQIQMLLRQATGREPGMPYADAPPTRAYIHIVAGGQFR